MSSDIMSISRLRMATDGRGITTLVAFYGCPLNCKYCINRQCHKNVPRGDYTAEELVKVLKKDELYYLMTDGGVTFGGGEPLLQSEFIHILCNMMNKRWRRVVETSLYVPWENIEILLNDIDYWYIDIKDLRPEGYKKYTGKDNQIVIVNLIHLLSTIDSRKVCIRIPYIPKFNTYEDVKAEKEYILEKICSTVDVECFDYIRC